MPKTLSKTGRTTFVVENIDWPFIMEALEHYKRLLKESDIPPNALITKDFIEERIESLIETFNIETRNK